MLHATRQPELTLLTYGYSDIRSAARARVYARALRRAQHTVLVRSFPGVHQWAAWRPALLACLRVLVPAH